MTSRKHHPRNGSIHHSIADKHWQGERSEMSHMAEYHFDKKAIRLMQYLVYFTGEHVLEFMTEYYS